MFFRRYERKNQFTQRVIFYGLVLLYLWLM